MRTYFLTLVCVFALLLSFGEVAAATFTRDLRVGNRGSDVLALQQMLNENPRTRVAETGAGSPGLETDYFGYLTESAVIRFQELYRADILAPIGLSRGTGFVGIRTRSKLEEISGKDDSFEDAILDVSDDRGPESLDFSPPPSPTDPEAYADYLEENADRIIGVALNAAVDLSDGERDDLEEMMRESLEDVSPRDIEDFFDAVGEAPANVLTTDDIINVVDLMKNEDFDEAEEIIFGGSETRAPFIKLALDFLKPRRVEAQSPLPPFGGFVYPLVGVCNCSGGLATRVVIEGYPQVSGSFDYITNSQAYLWHNFPFSVYGTGLYLPGVQGSCWTTIGAGCSIVPGAIGTMTPVIGSGLL